jgi:hypothetical protein
MFQTLWLLAVNLDDGSAENFIYLLITSLAVGAGDAYLWKSKKKTISERIWTINQWTLALAFLGGLLAGHLFTVPK